MATLLNVAFVAATVGLAAAWAAALGLPRRAALVVGGLLALSADLWQPALVTLSEPLFLVVMVGSLLAAARTERVGGPRSSLVLAVLLLALVYVRSAGVALVGGAVAGLALRRRWREAGLVGAVTGLGMLPWAVWSRAATASLPPPLRDILGGYGGWLSEQVRRDPEAYLAFLARGGVQDGRLLLSMLAPGAEGALLGALALPLALLLVIGLARLARRSPTAVAALALLLAEVWVWPYQAGRLLLPALPIVAVALALAFHALWTREAFSPTVRRGARAAALVFATSFAAASAVRLMGTGPTGPYLVRARMLANTTALVERLTPPGATVAAPEFWATIVLVTDRGSTPSAPFRPDPTGRVSSAGSPAEQVAVWEAGGAEYLLLENGRSVHGDALDLLERSCPGSVSVAGQAGNQMLLRLEPDDPCRRAFAAGD